MSIEIYKEQEVNKKYNEDEYYVKIKSYIALLRSKNYEEKEIAEKFFESNKKDAKLYETLNNITKNLDETNDIRIHSLQILKRYYVFKQEYIKYKADEENLLEIGIEPELHNALPSAFSNDNNYTPLAVRISNGYDSLSYIDPFDDNRLKEEMERLFKEEMAKFKPKDYLKEVPLPKYSFLESDMIKQEMQRFEKMQGKSSSVINKIVNKFEIPPPSKYYDERNWKALMNQIDISQQHLNLKSLNLELLIKYGPNAWRKYLGRLENVVKQLEIEKNSYERENEEINKRRKFTQIEAQKTFTDLKNKYKYHLSQVNALRKECLKLKFRIKRLHISKKARIERMKKKNGLKK